MHNVVYYVCRDIPVDMKYVAEPHMHSMPAVTIHPNGEYVISLSLSLSLSHLLSPLLSEYTSALEGYSAELHILCHTSCPTH